MFKCIRLILLFIICIAITGLSCNARQLSQEDIDFYNNLKHCVPMKSDVYNVNGFVNNKCSITMSLKMHPNNEKSNAIFFYEYPQEVLEQIVEDAINLPQEVFRNKWSPKEEEYCTSIIMNGKEIYSR